MKMKDLRQGSRNDCVTLLREFIEGSGKTGAKKRIAVMALEQLQRVKAGTDTGTDTGSDPTCNGRPRAG